MLLVVNIIVMNEFIHKKGQKEFARVFLKKYKKKKKKNNNNKQTNKQIKRKKKLY